jgi:signal peptidase I
MSERDLYGPPPEDTEEVGGWPSRTPSAPADDQEPELPAWMRSELDGDGYPPGAMRAPTTPEPVGGGAIALGLLAGLAAAVMGAAVWGWVARWTGYDLGVIAWGIGLLVGAAILVATRKRGYELQLVGVVCSLLGVLLGKYLAYIVVSNDELGYDLSPFSRDAVDLFRSSLGEVFSAYDLLWVGLAVGSAWLVLIPREDAYAGTEEHHSRNPVDKLTRGLPHGMRVAVDWAVTIAGAVAIVLLVKAYVVNPYRIPSSSMEPTLHCARPGNDCEARFSDRVLANRFIYHFRDPKRGEIVVFKTPPRACGVGGTFVKRVIGLPGEKLEVRLIKGDGYVFINGRRLDEPYVREDRRQVSNSFGPITVPKDHYFMMGDNREQSCDSREWGSLPRQNLIGKVFLTYWPPNRLSLH